MNRDFEYWEHAYFYGWLGKLIVSAFIGIFLFAAAKYFIEPWVIETMCREVVRCKRA